jgi:hypothetical protein
MRAISALAADMPVNPKIAATIEIRKNIRAHFNNVIDVPFDGVDGCVYSNSTPGVAFQTE